MCIGDIDVRNDPRNLEFLDNCRVIEGSLSFVLIDHADPKDYQDLSYPKLREITGFFLAYRVTNLTSFSQLFPNLAVIGGEKLMFNYALVIYEMYALETIGLKSLTRISRGAIRIEKNFKLCYIDTIDWDSIMNIEDKENNIVTENKRVSECANHCPGMEKQRCRKMLPHGSVKALCWSNEDCQRSESLFYFYIFFSIFSFVTQRVSGGLWPLWGLKKICERERWRSLKVRLI